MAQRVIKAAQILWPAFMIAGVLEIVVFSWVDPAALRMGSWQPSPETTYSLAFLFFWALVATSALLSQWMAQPPADDAHSAEPAVHTP